MHKIAEDNLAANPGSAEICACIVGNVNLLQPDVGVALDAMKAASSRLKGIRFSMAHDPTVDFPQCPAQVRVGVRVKVRVRLPDYPMT